MACEVFEWVNTFIMCSLNLVVSIDMMNYSLYCLILGWKRNVWKERNGVPKAVGNNW